MRVFKLQFEIRFTSIIDFHNQYRGVVAPFLKLCDFNISNQDTHQEILNMLFKDANYYYDIRWDRIIFVSEGSRSDLLDAQGPLFDYFNILKGMIELPNFGVIKNALIGEFSLLDVDADLPTLKQKFAQQFYTEHVPTEYRDFNRDFAIDLEFTKDKKEVKMHFGPFDNDTDVEKFQLSPIKNKPKDFYNDFKGIIMNSVYFEPLAECDLNIFRRMLNSLHQFRDQIKLEL